MKRITPHLTGDAGKNAPHETRFQGIYDQYHLFPKHRLHGIEKINYPELDARFALFGVKSECDWAYPWYKMVYYGYPNPKGSLKMLMLIVEMDEH